MSSINFFIQIDFMKNASKWKVGSCGTVASETESVVALSSTMSTNQLVLVRIFRLLIIST